MYRFWRKLRLPFLSLLFLLLAFYLFNFTPWRRFLGIHSDYSPLLAQGRPIAAAIYRYHADTHLWPQYLDDLSPTYLPTPPPKNWYFTLDHQLPSLVTATDSPSTYLGFDFDPVSPHWQLFGPDDHRILESWQDAATTHPAPPETEKIIASELATLDLRIAREKQTLDHRIAKAALLKSLHRIDEARTVITQTQSDFPESYWPLLATAALTPSPADIQSFAQWTAARPSFTHFYYLALLYRFVNDNAQAGAAIESALKEPLTLSPDDPNILPAYLFDLARYSLSQNNNDLTLQIANAWEKSQTGLRHPEPSYLAFRAAVQLHQKNFPAARQSLTALTADKTPHWAQNLTALQTALEKKDPTFPYNPGPTPPPYDIFPLPQ